MHARSGGRWLVGFFGVLAVLGAGEAAAQPEEVEGTFSNYEVSPTSATVSGAGGSGTFDITWDWEAPDPGGICFINCTEASCSDPGFIVRSSATWLSGTNRNGVRVDYTVQAHTGASSRTGTLTVAGATFTVTQPGVTPCPSSPDSLSPSPLSFGGAGGMQDMTVAGRSDCTWTVSDDQDWIDTTPSSVSGGDTVAVEVDINPGDARTGSVTVGGRGVSVSQGELPPCTLSSLIVAPTSLSFGSGADSADVRATIRLRLLLCRLDLSVSDDRSWIAASVSSIAPPSLPWPELTGVTVTVTIDVDVNGGSRQRSGTVMIGSRSVTVTQTPANRVPTARDDIATTTRNRAVTVRVLENDRDPDGDSLAVDGVVAMPGNGTATVGGDRQSIDYTPSSGWTGETTFTYRVTDGRGGTADAQVAVTVRAPEPENRPPVAVPDTAETTRNTSVTVRVLENDRDPDGDSLAVTRSRWRESWRGRRTGPPRSAPVGRALTILHHRVGLGRLPSRIA